MVTCPVCKGTLISPYTGETCQCCKGKGEITEKLAKAKEQIKKDLAKKLLQSLADIPTDIV